MITASQLLMPSHPLHAVFIRWLGGAPPTKRKARRFLAKFPQYQVLRKG